MTGHDKIMKTAQQVADDYHGAFASDLISVMLYGSAVTAEYDPKKSDLNFLIVLSEEGIEQLHLAHTLAAKWRKKRVGTPLFLTKAYIESSLDTFPIEFLNMKRNCKLISGEDLLEKLTFKKDFIRMQCERELKGKLLLLRERYVETGGKAKDLRELISASVHTFIFVFRALLYLLDKEVPATKRETVIMLARELDLDEELFLSLLQIGAGTLKRSQAETDDIFKRYMKQIRSLALLMDSRDFRRSAESTGVQE
jgi:predicted nucleotidyltransferase